MFVHTRGFACIYNRGFLYLCEYSCICVLPCLCVYRLYLAGAGDNNSFYKPFAPRKNTFLCFPRVDKHGRISHTQERLNSSQFRKRMPLVTCEVLYVPAFEFVFMYLRGNARPRGCVRLKRSIRLYKREVFEPFAMYGYYCLVNGSCKQ